MRKFKLNPNLRVILWGIRLFLVRYKFLFSAIFSLGLIFLIFFSRYSFRLPPRTPVFKAGFISQVVTPADLPDDIAQLLSSGLTALTPEGEATSGLALRWEQNSEGNEFTFFLKPDTFWQDGEPLKSADIECDIPDVTVTYPDESKIKFSLKTPFSPFPMLLSQPVFKQHSFLGVGPCQVTKVEKTKEIITRLLVSCPEKNLSLDLRFYPTEEDGLTALNLGEIKALFGPREIKSEKALSGFNFYQRVCYDRFVIVFFNLRDPFLAGKEVRQALNFAIPKQGFVNRALGPINPQCWAYNPNLKEYNFDLEEAKRLLEELELPSELRLRTTPVYQKLAQEIADSWKQLGIEVKVETKAGEEVTGEEFQALLVGQKVSPDPDQYSLWHSTQETNITGLKSPKIDKFLEDGREIFDKEKRKEIYQDFQKYLVEECPAAFLYYPTEYILVSKKIDSPILHELFKIRE